MKLSRFFTLSEMTRSDTASRHNIINTPSQDELINLVHLCDNILDPIRSFFNKPLTVTSGYRCIELNSKIGSKDTSQHIKGQAADIKMRGIDNLVIAQFIMDSLSFDQLIAEKLSNDYGQKGWVHVSYNFLQPNRKNVMSFLGDRYVHDLRGI